LRERAPASGPGLERAYAYPPFWAYVGSMPITYSDCPYPGVLLAVSRMRRIGWRVLMLPLFQAVKNSSSSGVSAVGDTLCVWPSMTR